MSKYYQNFHIICGALIVRPRRIPAYRTGRRRRREKNEEFLLVQEAKKRAWGKWNLPAGHLHKGEDIADAARRETKEEVGLRIKLRDFLGVYSRYKKQPGTHTIRFIFTAEVKGGKINFPKKEILQVRWFSSQEILKMKDDQLRIPQIKDILKDYLGGKKYPLDIVKFYIRDKFD